MKCEPNYFDFVDGVFTGINIGVAMVGAAAMLGLWFAERLIGWVTL